MPGKQLREKGINRHVEQVKPWIEIVMFVRIGNLLVPNNNYVKFEEWLMPILDKLLEEQNNKGVVWTPSKIIHRFLPSTM